MACFPLDKFQPWQIADDTIERSPLMAAGDDIVIDGPRPILIPATALDWQFVRSSGPGGQHVNRTSSKAILRFDLRHTPYLPGDVRQRMLAALRPRLTNDGAILITSQRHRDRGRNIADCQAKLASLIKRALVPPTVRRRTKTPRSAIANRLEGKKRRSVTKRLRRLPPE
jgi:ribosome-associated protein